MAGVDVAGGATTPRASSPARSGLAATVLHLVGGVLLLAVAVASPVAGLFLNDVPTRYWPIAELTDPWVAEPVEFPPVTVALLEPLALVDQAPSVWVHVAIQLLLLVAVLVTLARGGGAPALWRWALFATPLVPLVLLRNDLASVLACTLALVAARRESEVAAGIALAVGVLAKLWPGALVLVFWRRHRTAAVVGAAASVLGTMAWVAATTADAPLQVLGFRGATGWHMESVVGSLVRLVDGGAPVLEAGAWRFGEASAVPTLVLGVVALACSLAVARRVDDPARVLLTVLATGLVAAPLLSPQYAVWLLPALALTERLRPSEAVAAGGVVVGSVAVLWWLGDVVAATGLGWTVLLLRNTAVVGLAVAVVTTGLRGDPSGRAAAG